jgi:hypothetical protein
VCRVSTNTFSGHAVVGIVPLARDAAPTLTATLTPRVALDRGLRLAEKRCLPCPNRVKWITARDKLHEEIQNKGWK